MNSVESKEFMCKEHRNILSDETHVVPLFTDAHHVLKIMWMRVQTSKSETLGANPATLHESYALFELSFLQVKNGGNKNGLCKSARRVSRRKPAIWPAPDRLRLKLIILVVEKES